MSLTERLMHIGLNGHELVRRVREYYELTLLDPSVTMGAYVNSLKGTI